MVFLTNEFGKCDTCNKSYVLGDRFKRCGDCGDCGNCCQHKQPESGRHIANAEMKG